MQPPQPPHGDPVPSPAFGPDPHQSTQSTAISGRPPRQQRLAWIAPSVVTGIVTALFVAVLAHLALGVPLPFGLSDPPPVPADWQTYRDPAGLVAIRLPPNWSVRFDSGTGTFGDRTGSATETTEEITFSDPTQGDTSPWVSISASPIHTDFERHWYCQAFSNTNDSFHGLPAQSMSDVEWIFETANAHFQVDYGIPGVKGPPHSSPPMLTPVPTPTPLPPDTVSADQTLIDTILGSFQPTDPHTLSCP